MPTSGCASVKALLAQAAAPSLRPPLAPPYEGGDDVGGGGYLDISAMRLPKNPFHPDQARVLGTSAKLWMNLQATFDLDKAMRRRKIN